MKQIENLKMTNKFLYFIAGILLIACSPEEEGDRAAAQRTLSVEFEVLKEESISNTIKLPATILPFEEVMLYPEVAGRVDKIFFKEGEFVKKGTPLLKIDSDILEAQKQQLEVELKFAKKEEDRTEKLYEAEAGSFEAYELAQGKVANLEAQLRTVSVEIDKATLRAPFEGNVGLRLVSPGAFLTTTDMVARLAQQSPLKIEFSISQKYADGIEAGQKIEVLNKKGDVLGDAKVYAFDPQIESSNRSLKVRAKMDNDEKIFPGSFVNINYQLKEIENGIMIPTSAVSPVLNGQQIWLIRNGKAESKIVELGIRTSDKVQILGEVEEGDTLVTTGLLSMREGLNLKGKIKTN